MKREELNIHMLRKYIDLPYYISILRIFLVILDLIFFIQLVSYRGWLILSAPLVLWVAYLIDSYLREVHKNFVLKYSLRKDLVDFIKNNKLFEEESRDVLEGHTTKSRKFIINTAVFNYRIIENKKLIIEAVKRGDALSKRMEALDVELESLIGLELTHKIIRPTLVEYHFWLQKPERLIVKAENKQKIPYYEPLNLGYGVTYDPVKTPHILVAGGTGSGKSVFISYLILELLKRDSTLYICDPKNSDLGSLSHFMGADKVATDSNNIARVLRTAVKEMNARYANMRENFKYGANFADHGYNQIWVVFDEMGAFQATGTDKDSKAVVNEVMAYLKQIILLGRQAGVFVLIAAQQMRAETLNTDLRDNLGLRIALGANSSEGYRMTFGSATPTPESFQPIELKGSGYLYLQGSGNEFAEYFEAPFMDTKKINFIEELKRLL